MEDNNEKQLPKQTQDNGVLWALLLTLGMIAIMAILKHIIG